MKLFSRLRRTSIAGTVAGALGLMVAAGQGFAQDVVEEARAALPAEMRESGILKVATNFSWPPFAYKDESGKETGIDIELVKLLAAKLGLEPEFEDLKFPSIIPGVSNGRYDVGVNQFGITAERQQVAQFLPYFDTGFSLLVPEGKTEIDINNLCGRTIVITQGSALVSVVQDRSDKCVAAGDPEINLVFFKNTADTLLALTNGRGDGFVTARPVGIYIAETSEGLDVASGTLEDYSSINGIALGKERDDLFEALSLALKSAIEDGSYNEALGMFDSADGGLTLEQIEASSGD
ncbi:amino acid ABC transporter substrate-binding protein, PAAT family [Roseovarius pacificus]|uniref:Amino acid ABC transporter substrate-binding protein, PAAT family n=1 Tax=Roseovarius pacificus TaxID=337701 RepID=A0A1M7BD28_9RHOB|nr:transporter substrate-binding domain-containing protein [Roseovarius pacificus]GGO54923.1 ABC transporter substrate-binding protein [Roseovarius pacificus]SHL52766.1 amino acid ABC transporter substrate-binding protein, PAAT family [Roseovarius pacificus]